MKSILFTLLLLTSTLSLADGELRYIHSEKARLLAEPSFGAPLVSELPKGAEVRLLESKKRWHKVQAGEQSGWVSSFLLSAQPPLNKVTVLDGSEQKELAEGARRRASAVTTAGAARGLTADDRKRVHANERADFHALEQVEDFNVESKEVDAFAKEGKLR